MWSWSSPRSGRAPPRSARALPPWPSYQIKSNAIDNLTADLEGGAAVFQSKGTLQDVTNPLAPVSSAGNLLIQTHVLDGNPDRIGFTLRNSSGQLLYASAWNGASAAFMDLIGGNVVVR
jgi:hypothetical protein